MIQTCTHTFSSNWSPHKATKSNQSADFFNRKSISRNTTHPQCCNLIQILRDIATRYKR